MKAEITIRIQNNDTVRDYAKYLAERCQEHAKGEYHCCPAGAFPCPMPFPGCAEITAEHWMGRLQLAEDTEPTD